MGQRGKREMRRLLLAKLYQGRRTNCFLWMRLLFLTRIDIARIFNSFFFERQQYFIWKRDTIWVFVKDSFLLGRAQLSIWDPTCAAAITMAPSDRQDKKPKDASPWLWTAPTNSVSLYLRCLHDHRRSPLTSLTSSKTRPAWNLSHMCNVLRNKVTNPEGTVSDRTKLREFLFLYVLKMFRLVHSQTLNCSANVQS